MSWLVAHPYPGVVHVLPVDDLVDHQTEESCVCSPTPKHEITELHVDDQVEPVAEIRHGTLWVHHSLDGREQDE